MKQIRMTTNLFLICMIIIPGIVGVLGALTPEAPQLTDPAVAPEGTIAVITDLPKSPAMNRGILPTVNNLTALGLPVDVYYNNWYANNGGNYTSNLAFLEQYL